MSESTTFAEVARWGAIIVGMVLSFALAVVLIAQAPPYVLLTIAVLVFLGWIGVRTGYLSQDDESEKESERDPLTVLQKRYAAGEVSESEFEHRLERILESDQLVAEAGERPDREIDRSDTGDVAVADLEREREFERE